MVKYIPYKQLFIYYKSRKNEGVHMEINIGIIGEKSRVNAKKIK